MKWFSRPTWFAVLVLSLMLPRWASALQVTGYTAAANDRFESGLPSNPVESSSASFIGKGYDWSGAGWDSTNLQKGFGFLSPTHYLVASHYLGSTYVNVNDQDSDLVQGTQQGVEATGYGLKADGTNPDISIGTLTQPLPATAPMARYAVLDLNSTSTTNASTAYNNLAVLLYGRGATTTSSPRIGATTINSTTVSGTDTYFRTLRTDVQLEGGDSGSPAFHGWTNPNGGQELTLLGLNSAIDTTYNYMSFLGNSGAINAMNSLMVDNGFALRVAGNVSNTWAGSRSTSIGSNKAWAISSSAPSDVYVKFDAATAGSRSVLVDSNANLRGLYFKETATSGDSFSFAGASTLTIGRGGITNYDDARQSLSANMTLGDHQYWDAGTGGVTVANLNTNGKLLEITGSATISGAISGSGGIALTSGALILSGNSSYTGKTWSHAGRLQVDGNISSSSGLVVDSDAALFGKGSVGAVSGSGSIDPGNSPGILTATSVDTSAGIDFHFEFTAAGSPDYGNPAASINDVLRLTSATAPFSQQLSLSNTISVFLNVATLEVDRMFEGGIFTDRDMDFLSSIEKATYLYYIADFGGTHIYNGVNYSAYSGFMTFEISTVQKTAGFATGSETGYVLIIQTIPEPTTVFLIGMGLISAWIARRRRAVR